MGRNVSWFPTLEQALISDFPIKIVTFRHTLPFVGAKAGCTPHLHSLAQNPNFYRKLVLEAPLIAKYDPERFCPIWTSGSIVGRQLHHSLMELLLLCLRCATLSNENRVMMILDELLIQMPRDFSVWSRITLPPRSDENVDEEDSFCISPGVF